MANPPSERLSELFADLLEAEPEHRRERLEAERASDPRLAAELEALLSAHRAAPGFLGPLDTESALSLLAEEGEAASDIGLLVGPFRLTRLLGRGGMGVVYLAERVEGGFDQRVAVKLVQPEMSRNTILERFLAERRILARLEHPNIARLLDGGMSADGRPYFALEFVEGDAITLWCDQHALDVDARLRLFVRVCEAVRYAHSNLVVHRDLKPSNILVDGGGEPKLLDFGIAKLLQPDADEEPMTLADGAPPALTPEYAAPEQLTGGAVTTATDVYALGVVLYELLTGLRPHRMRRGLFGLVPDPLPEEPRRPPSTAVLEPVDDEPTATPRERSPAGRARRRGADPARLARRLSGDLDAIVLRALEAEPARRYGSAEALAEDLRRHLEGRPVEARSARLGDRARLFARRHRTGVAATGAVVLALAVGLAFAVSQAQRAAREAQQARAALGFLTDVLESVDPTRSMGETVTAGQLLDEGALRLRADSTLEPTVRAELADTLARTYRGLGRLDEARAAAEEARSILARQLGAESPRTLLAMLTQAEIDSDRGELAPARRTLEQILPRLERALEPGSPELLRARIAHASVLGSAGEFDLALAEERQILEMVRVSRGDRHPETAERLGSLASALAAASRYEEAERALREALGILAVAGAAASPRAAHLKTTLADLLDIVGRPEEADRYFREALQSARATLGPRHPRVAQTLIKRGAFLIGQDRPVEAEADLEEAIAILEPIGHFDAGAALRYLGFLHLGAERFAEAERTFARAESLLHEKLGADHPLTWAAAVTTAYATGRRGDLAAAESRLREAIRALERLHGADSNDVRVPRKYLGQILRLAGRPAEALEIHLAALRFERELMGGDDNGAVTASKELIVQDLLDLGGAENLVRARLLLDEALATAREREPASARAGRLLALSARLAGARADPARARADLAEALGILESALPPDAPSVREARRALTASAGSRPAGAEGRARERPRRGS